MIKKTSKLLATLTLGALAAGTPDPASAATITLVQYSMGGTAATTEAADVTAGALTAGSALTVFNTGNTFGQPTAPILGANPNDSLIGETAGTGIVNAAFTENNFFSFTITPGSGLELNLDELTFLAARVATSGVRSTGVRSSLTGTTNLEALELTAIVGSTNTSGGTIPLWETITVDLSSNPVFQNIDSTVTFQIAVASDANFRAIAFDDITITGEVVPEPSSLALLGLGCLLVARRQRDESA